MGNVVVGSMFAFAQSAAAGGAAAGAVGSAFGALSGTVAAGVAVREVASKWWSSVPGGGNLGDEYDSVGEVKREGAHSCKCGNAPAPPDQLDHKTASEL